MVYSAIQNSVLNEKKLPLLTLVNRWLKPSTNCYLCPNHYPKLYGDDTLVFTMSFTTFMYKPGYQAWINEVTIHFANIIHSIFQSKMFNIYLKSHNFAIAFLCS